MYKTIVFKNIKGTPKLNVLLDKPLESLADITENQAVIIHYLANTNEYSFVLATELDTKCASLNETSFNIEYMKNYLKNSKVVLSF